MKPWLNWFCVGFSMFLGRYVFGESKEFSLAIGLVTAVLILSMEVEEIRKFLRKE